MFNLTKLISDNATTVEIISTAKQILYLQKITYITVLQHSLSGYTLIAASNLCTLHTHTDNSTLAVLYVLADIPVYKICQYTVVV